MTNVYLEKIAKDTDDGLTPAEKVIGGVALGGVGVGVAKSNFSQIPGKILGYHDAYHGTSTEYADLIKKHGFDPSKGGSGSVAYSNNPTYVVNSADHTYFTKHKGLAKVYADIVQTKNKGGMGQLVSSTFGLGQGEVLHTRIPHSIYERASIDTDSVGFRQGEAAKATAFKTKEYVKANVAKSSFLNKDHLSSYYGSSSGRLRALSSLKNLAVGSAGLATAGLLTKALLKSKEVDSN